MRTDLFLITKYWKKHKKHFFRLMASIIVIASMLLFVILIEQTECRRKYDTAKHALGAANIIFQNVDDEVYKQISNMPETKDCGRIFVDGFMGNEEAQYTYGCYENEEAQKLDYLELINGRMPKKSGEIAVYDFVLQELYKIQNINECIGNSIVLKKYDFQKKEIGEMSMTIVGVIKSNELRTLTESSADWNIYTDIPMPSFIVNINDCDNIASSINFMLITHKKAEYENVAADTVRLSLREKCAEKYNLYMIGDDGLSEAASGLTNYQANNDMYNKVYNSDTMQIIKTLSILVTIIAAVSLLGTMYAVMDERNKSLKIARSLGYSKWQMVRLIVFELTVLFAIGFILGIMIGLFLYEAVLGLENVVWKLPYLSAFESEWAIKQCTENPYAFSFVCSLSAYILGCVVYEIKICTTGNKKVKKCNKVRSFRKIKRKISGDIFTNTMQVALVAFIIFTITMFYSYFTMNGKGVGYFSNPELLGYKYYEYAGINMQEDDVELCIYSDEGGTAAYGLMVDSDFGLPISSLNSIKDITDVKSIRGYAVNLAGNIIYPQDSSDVPLFIKNNFSYELSEEMKKFYQAETSDVYQLPMVMCSDDSICELKQYLIAGEIGLYDNGVTLIYSEDASEAMPYKVGDTIPMAAYLMDDDKQSIKEQNEFNVIVEAIAVLPDSVYENDKITSHIFGNDLGVAIAYTAHASFDTYSRCYDYTYISYTEDADNRIIMSKVREYITQAMHVKMRSLDECKREYMHSKLESYLSIVFIIGILVLMTFVGYSSILSMKLINNQNSKSIIKALGMTERRILYIYIMDNIRLTLVSIVLGGGIIWSVRHFLMEKYNQAVKLIEESGMLGADADKFQQIIKFEKKYFLDYEIYNASIKGFFFKLSIVIVFVAIGSVLVMARKSSCKDFYNEMRE